MFFKETGWPETCYVPEVAYWLAFGRVPEYFPEDRGDMRMGDEAKESGEIVEFDWGYSPQEFRHFGMEVDFDRYEDADPSVEKARDSFAQTMSLIVSAEERADKEGADQIAVMKEMFEGSASEREDNARWRAGLDSQLSHVVEMARSKVFGALCSGVLRAHGWTAHAGAEEGGFVEIPAVQWTMRGFDWETSTLHFAGKEYRAVQVEADRIFEAYPRPDVEPVRVTFDLYPGVAILTEDSASDLPSASRKRGRREHGDGLVKVAVTNHLTARLKEGYVPANLEGLIAEGQMFAENILSVTLSRSTMQSYLSAIRPLLPEKPKKEHARNSAGNSAGK